MNPLTKLWNLIPATFRLIVGVAIVLCVILIVWLYGTKATNSLSRWWHNRQVEELRKENDQLKQEREALKAEWQKLRGEFEASKQETARYKAEREKLEKELADQTATANAKLAALRKLLAQPVTPISPDISDEELCRRSERLGVPCGK